MSRKLVTAALALAVLALPWSAQAEVVRGPEPVGDTVAWQLDPVDPLCGETVPVESPEGAGAGDLVGLSVRHKRYQVAITARYAEGRARKFLDLHLDTPGGRWSIDFSRSAHDRFLDVSPEPTWELQDWDTDEDGIGDCQVWIGMSGYQPCGDRSHAHVSDDRRSVRIVVPRHCLGNPRWVRAGATAFDHVGGFAVVDEWNPAAPSTHDDTFDPNAWTYGARVLAGPDADTTPVPEPDGRITRRTTILSMDGLVNR